VVAGDPDRWDELLGRLAEGVGDRPYRHPAPIVHRILGRRPRLALLEEHVAVLAAELDAVHADIGAAAPRIVGDVATGASAGGTPATGPPPGGRTAS
jgi:hypothetical protein